MTRRIILTIVAAVALALLVGLVWFFFFRDGIITQPNNGQFGTGTTKTTGTTGTTKNQNNTPSGVLSDTNINVGTPVTGGGTTGSSISGGGGSSGGAGGIQSVPGVDWLGGSSAGSGGGPTSNFVPKTINDLNSGVVSGSPSILPGGGGTAIDSNGNSILGPALVVAGIGAALCTAGLLGGATASLAGNAVETVTAVPVSPRYLNTVATADTVRENFLNCIARTIARAAVQQITSSVVNWINSGFNGKPSFVTNYKQFFTNVADQAAGEFIRGSALSFLCSPFQAQIRVALAQSYARRNNAASCTLTGIIKNINAFANGNFSQGGWGGLLSFVGTPTNNPFGAYQDGLGKLSFAVNSAVGRKQEDYILGKGFLSSEKESNCRPAPNTGGISTKMICDKVVTTPGSTIADSLSSTLNVSKETLTQAGISGSFDAIISALISQLMVKALQGGVSNLSGSQGYAANFLTPEQQQAQADAQGVLTALQGQVNLAQQYGSVQQGIIGDIQNTQSQLQNLVNCWESKLQGALATSSARALHSYDPLIDNANNNIMRANQGIATLQDLQTAAIGVSGPGDVAAVKAAYSKALALGTLITQSDITSAQQDRATLQNSLATRNQLTTTELNQCYAFN